MHPFIPNLHAGIVKEALRFRSLFCNGKSGPAVRLQRSTGPDLQRPKQED